MTTTTIFSTISYNQNAQGIAPVPAPTVVNAGALVTRHSFVLTVSPTTGWAKALTKQGTDGVNFPRGSEIFVAPNSGGTSAVSGGAPGVTSPPEQYFTGELLEVGPAGTTATLTVTY